MNSLDPCLPVDIDPAQLVPGKIGACILTYNSNDFIGKCLSALQAAFPTEKIEIVCVDNASAAGPGDIVRQNFPTIHFIQNPANVGYSAGNNVGARYLLEKGCEYLVFVNPDVFVQPDTLQEMRSILRLDSTFGCVGGCEGKDGVPSERPFKNRPNFGDVWIIYGSARNLPGLRWLIRPYFRHRFPLHYLPHGAVPRGSEVYAVGGPCIMFSARAFAAVGGFDERSFMYAEEFIMGEALRRHGYKVVAAPTAFYEHLSGACSEDSSPGFRRFLSRQFAGSTFVYLWHYRGWRFRALLIRAFFFLERQCWFALDVLKQKMAFQR